MKRLLIKSLLSLILFNIPVCLYSQTSLEEIISDMSEPHEGRPHGVPSNFNWAINPRPGAEAPPDDWDAAIAWGQLYEWIDGNPATNTRVQIRDLELHYLSKTDLQWHELQVSLEVDGAAYVEDFAGDVNKPADKRKESDGSISVTAGDGYNFHFWPKQGRVNFPKGDVKGCYATVRARLILDDPDGIDDRESARYVMSVGGDWWESLSAVWDNWTTNWDMGIGRFRFVTSEWKSFNMITLPADTVRKYPPNFHIDGPVGSLSEHHVKGQSLKINPNPVHTACKVSFTLHEPGVVNISVLTADGKTVYVLSEDKFNAGEQSFFIDTSDFQNGIYVLRLEYDAKFEIGKLLVVK